LDVAALNERLRDVDAEPHEREQGRGEDREQGNGLAAGSGVL
jgi:hypothetical protein